MNWETFIAVITWSVTVLAALAAIALIASNLVDYWEDGESAPAWRVTSMIGALITFILGAATIGGMGWIN